MWEKLKEKLKSILTANTLIQEVFDWEVEKFTGDPVATLTPSANEAHYSTTTDNRRIYAFIIRLFVERTSRKDQDAERIMTTLVDSVIDDIDKNYTLTGIVPPTGYTMLFVEATPASWGYVGREEVYRAAEIVVKCHVDADVSLIS